MGAGEVGHVALVLGAIAAAVAAVASFLGRDRLSRGALRASFVFTTAAVAALGWALFSSDFSLAYVADHSTRSTSWTYRLAGLWGGMEGSLLFWGWLLIAWALVAGRAVAAVQPAVASVARAVLSALGGVVLLVVLLLADPFRRLAVPALDGGGLSPILRHPAMLYHPPLLYLGQTCLAVPFAVTVAALARGALDRAWLACARRWLLVSWALLAAAVLAGARWAYAELGWGGFYAWDPVENGALLPWLAATAALHGAAVRRRAAGLEWGTAALVLLTFCLAFLGAVVTRSGVTVSVHAFAEARGVGRALAVVLAVLIVASAALLWRRRPRAGPPEGIPAAPGGGDSALVAGAGLLLAIAAVVAFGTILPLVVDITDGGRLAVSGRYFALVTAPPALALLALMGVGPFLAGRALLPPGRRLLGPALALAAACLAAAVLAGVRQPFALGVSALAPATAVFVAADCRRRAAAVAHLGAVLVLVGVAGASTGAQGSAVLDGGETMRLGGWTLRLEAVHGEVADEVAGGTRATAVVALEQGGRRVAVLRPSLDVHPGSPRPLAETAVRSTLAGDVQVALRRVEGGTAVLDVVTRPLIAAVWWGGLLVVAGGILALRSRRPSPPGPAAPPPAASSRARPRRLPAFAAAAGRGWAAAGP